MSLFISFEGGEGSGKSTQAAILVRRLQAAGYHVTPVHEPGTTKLGEYLRAFLKRESSKKRAMSHQTELLLFAAARAEPRRQDRQARPRRAGRRRDRRPLCGLVDGLSGRLSQIEVGPSCGGQQPCYPRYDAEPHVSPRLPGERRTKPRRRPSGPLRPGHKGTRPPASRYGGNSAIRSGVCQVSRARPRRVSQAIREGTREVVRDRRPWRQ